MHLLAVETVALDDSAEAVDLGGEPADIVALSFAESDLAGLGGAHARGAAGSPAQRRTLRLVALRRLRHPMSVDLFAERIVARARFVLVRCLGGLDYWRYGVERLAATCRAGGIPLAIVPGCERPDPRLAAHSTVGAGLLAALEAEFRAGGPGNHAAILARIAAAIDGAEALPATPPPVPRAFAWVPGRGAMDPAEALAALDPSAPLAHVLVYRSGVLAGDAAVAEALAEALTARGVAPLILAASSLKDPEAAAILARVIRMRRPAVILSTTAFAARDDSGFVLDRADCPVLQALSCNAPREAWLASARGLGAADLAMGAVLPEFDGRIAALPVSFKEEGADGLRRGAPDPIGIAATADRARAWIDLARTPRAARRLALVLSDYPARGGRAGFAVGLDTPASAAAILARLAAEGYATASIDPAALIPALTRGLADLAVPLSAYRDWLAGLPPDASAALGEAWGAPEDDPALRDGAFRFRTVQAGCVRIALQPDRGRAADRKAGYHDPALPPTHAYLAFHLGLRVEVDALIQLGTHGTAEWLPGKAVAPDAARCWPALVAGATPILYPFVVDDPGEAAPAKRRLGAVTIGHATPPVALSEPDAEAARLRERVEEYAAAALLDPRRAELVAAEILDEARAAGLAEPAGISAATEIPEALTRLDAHLCDLGEVAYRDGLHVFGDSPGEMEGLLAALDGRFVPPGPAGSPSRGRLDVLPTGRNLTTLDPRAVPTRAAAHLGERAAEAILRRHLQDEGEYPRRIVMDLWASPTLRTGGEDVATALALMGARPVWDQTTTRVSGTEIVPLALLDRPRVDVTLRVSGAFRDTFPDALALLDAAARALARREGEDDADNPLAAARRAGEAVARVFGAAPGLYGAGTAARALEERWEDRDDLGRAYLAATSHAFGATDPEGIADAGFARRVAAADAFVHGFDVPERDLLDGDAAAEALGGFAAAAALSGAAPALYALDATRPEDGPRVRTAREDAARLIRGRLAKPRWIAAQLRHGGRGVAELAQAVDAAYLLAATTDAVSGLDLDRLHAALLGDPETAERLEALNPDAARAIAARFADLAARGLWRTRRNSPLTPLPDAGADAGRVA